MENNENVPILYFRTSTDWTINDLQVFSKSIGGIYDAFLSIRIKQSLIDHYYSSLDEYLFLFEKSLAEPYSYELLKLWRNTIKLWKKQNKQMPLLFMHGLPLPFSIQEFDREIPSLVEIYKNIDFYKESHNNLWIHQIHISSPGLISFEGLGEIVREFRELIKDIFWRNKQEKAKGQLEIISKYVKIRKENPNLDIPIPTYLKNEKYLVETVNENVNNLKLLESKGKLLSVAENIDRPE